MPLSSSASTSIEYTTTVVDLAIVAISLAIVVGIGIVCSRGPKNTATYLLGSRSMPWWAIGVSYMMSILSPLAASLFANSADQISIQRLLGTKSYAQAKRSMLVFIALQLPVMVVLWTVGLAIFSFYGHQPEATRPASGDLALFQFIGTQLPTPIPGVIMAGMLAAVLSTIDSATNSLATVATKDFYLRLFRQSASETRQVDFSRVMTVLIGVMAVAGAILLAVVSGGLEESILEASRVWISFSGILAPVFLLGVTSRRLGAAGAICAMLAGWLATLPVMGWYVWSRLHPEHGTVSFIITAAPPLFVTLAVGYLIAAFSPRQPPTKTDDLTLFTLRSEGAVNEDY